MAMWNIRSQRRNGEDVSEVEVPADVQEQLDAAREAQEELKALKERDVEREALLLKMQGDITELSSRVAPPPSAVQAPAKPDYFTDPEGYFDHRLAPLVQVTLQNTARQELDMFSRQCADWRFFGAEVTDFVRKGSLQQQADPNYIRNCYLIVKGHHSEEIAAGKFSLVESGTGGASGSGDGAKSSSKEFKPTEEQIAFAKRYGISTEDVQKTGAGLRFM